MNQKSKVPRSATAVKLVQNFVTKAAASSSLAALVALTSVCLLKLKILERTTGRSGF